MIRLHSCDPMQASRPARQSPRPRRARRAPSTCRHLRTARSLRGAMSSRRARSRLAGWLVYRTILVLGCIEAKFCNQILVGKRAPLNYPKTNIGKKRITTISTASPKIGFKTSYDMLSETRWKALAEIYTMHSFAPFWPFSSLNFFVNNC